jgi:hypothetical protein
MEQSSPVQQHRVNQKARLACALTAAVSRQLNPEMESIMLSWCINAGFARQSSEDLPMPVETTKVEGRRKLDYQSLDEVLADAERLSAGPLKTLGNWSAGQIFRHLATAYNGSIDGIKMKLPWYLLVMARIFKRKLLRGPMPPGFKLPAESAEQLEPKPTSTEEGLAELRAAVERLKRESQRANHPAFGKFSKEEWNQIHLHHANLHMSFIVPK